MSPVTRASAVPRRAIVLIAVLVLMVAAVIVRSSASAQAPASRTLTVKELDKGSTFTHIRNTKARSRRSIAQGDLIVFTNPLADTSGHRIGKLSVDCTTTTGARNFLKSTLTCMAVLVLRDGTLTVQLNSSPGARTSAGAVTGGTGAYAGARGVIVSTHTETGADDTITLGA